MDNAELPVEANLPLPSCDLKEAEPWTLDTPDPLPQAYGACQIIFPSLSKRTMEAAEVSLL
ncbi:MAG: hypothetical protein HYS38_09090 [Acidobacteria bacterium]|nr:hypothetical protein [Acidobacteriota bacterium]